jgi:hypothetical protein
MKKRSVWLVVVRFGRGVRSIVRTIPTEVRDASNAIPWASLRNPGQGFDWDTAEVLKARR